MEKSSRALAREWPYPRRKDFEREMRTVATDYFKDNNLEVNKRYPFILAEWDMWPSNIVHSHITEH